MTTTKQEYWIDDIRIGDTIDVPMMAHAGVVNNEVVREPYTEQYRVLEIETSHNQNVNRVQNIGVRCWQKSTGGSRASFSANHWCQMAKKHGVESKP